MKHSKRLQLLVGVVVLGVILCVVTPLNTMISQKSTSRRVRAPQPQLQMQPAPSERYKNKLIWVKTSDNAIVEIPKWQIDQMKVLQVLFLYQKGENNKDNPVDAAMVTSEQLTLLQMALKNASNLEKFELFCHNLKPDEKTNLINGSLTLEVHGLASLLMNQLFSPEIQEKLGASTITIGGILYPVVKYLDYDLDYPTIVFKYQERVQCVAFSPDGKYIVSGSDDGNLIVWDAKTGEQIKVLQEHRGLVLCVAYSPDGNYIVSGSDDNNLILWNGKTGEQIKILKGHTSFVSCVAFSPDGNYIVSGSDDNNLILWDISPIILKNRIPNLLFSLKEHESGILPQDIVQLIGQNLIELSKIDIPHKVLQGHRWPVFCVAYSPDGNYIVSGSCNKNLILWNGKTGEQIKSIKEHSWAVSCVAYSPDGNYIVSGFYDKNLILWNSNMGEQIKILKGHSGRVHCVAYSPNGKYIISGSEGEINLILWNGTTGDQIKILRGYNSEVSCLAFSPDGNSIITAGDNSKLILFKLINEAFNFIARQLNIVQARFLYRLYLGKINNVPVVLDKSDLDYQIYLTLPQDVQTVIQAFLPFEESSVFVGKNLSAREQAVQEKMNEYKEKFKKTGASLADQIKTIKALMKDFDKNSVDYKACAKLLIELEQEAAFEV